MWRAVALVAMVGLVVMSLGWSAYSSVKAPANAFYLLPSRYWELGIGVLAWLAVSHRAEKLRGFFSGHGEIVIYLGFAAIFIGFIAAEPTRFPFPWGLVPVLGTTALLLALTARSEGISLPERLLKSRPMQWVGLRSYSLYLWHWPVFVLLRWTVGLEAFHAQMIALLLTFALAEFSYLVERRVRGATVISRAPRIKVVVTGLLCVFVAAVGVKLVFKAHNRITLSVTRDTDTWFPYGNLGQNVDTGCQIESVDTPLAGGRITTVSPSSCKAPASARKMFVLGDSHSTAYTTMLKMWAADNGTPVIFLNNSACPVFNLKKPHSELSPACKVFVAAALQYIKDNAKRGDILFLPALRVPRIGDQWEIPAHELQHYLYDRTDRTASLPEAISDLLPFRQAGLTLVLTAPTPVMPAPAFRCADWFNQENPVCKLGFSVSRQEMDSYLSNARNAVGVVAMGLGGVAIWDATPYLCESTACKSFMDGKPLLFDGDHLSGYANRLLYPHFNAFVKNLH